MAISRTISGFSAALEAALVAAAKAEGKSVSRVGIEAISKHVMPSSETNTTTVVSDAAA